ncbi:hypothetical protein A5655_00480 [Mycobacterium sp. 1081908.1]|nr:hypothetical protein A5655_00480 [Mycobacterium sp. 1081908.1]
MTFADYAPDWSDPRAANGSPIVGWSNELGVTAPPGMGLFCRAHLRQARRLRHLSSVAAVETMRVDADREPSGLLRRFPLAAAALTTALLAGLAAALGVGGAMASHSLTSGCIVDKSLQGLGMLSMLIAAMLGIVAAALGVTSLGKAGRARGVYFALAVAAAAIGASVTVFSLVWLVGSSGYHAIDPVYLHPC